MTDVLQVEDIHTYYGAVYVLQGVSLRVGRGAVVAVLGRNGAGKTTLLRSIMGLTPPRTGGIAYKGEQITRLPAHRMASLGIGYVPQGHRVFPSLSVGENLGVGLPMSRPSLRLGLERALDLFPQLKVRIAQRGGTLSGGEQQMLSTGRALVPQPDLMLMDEPTEGLAPLLVREMERIVQELKAGERSVLLVEQNISFALRVSDFVYVMNKGRIVHQCPPDELKRDEEVKSRYLGVGSGS